MCGIFAGAGKLESRLLTALGCLSSKRGTDSCGVAWWDQETKAPDHLKIAASPLTGFTYHLRDAMIKAAKSSLAIGHTRQATTGAVTSDNAHPFTVDGISWAHNGIVYNYQDFGTFTVDSEALLAGIRSRDFSKYRGSVGLVWLQDGKLYAYRKGNPLYRGCLRDGIYLASEQEFLSCLGMKKIKPLGEGRLYVFDATGKTIGADKIPENTSYVVGYQAQGSHHDYRDWRNEFGSEDYNRDGFWEEWDKKHGTHHGFPKGDRDKEDGFPPKKPDEKPIMTVLTPTDVPVISEAESAIVQEANKLLEQGRQQNGDDGHSLRMCTCHDNPCMRGFDYCFSCAKMMGLQPFCDVGQGDDACG